MEQYKYARKTFDIVKNVEEDISVTYLRILGRKQDLEDNPNSLEDIINNFYRERKYEHRRTIPIYFYDMKHPEYCGHAQGSSSKGYAHIFACGWNEEVIAHELGHAFGLPHDFSNNSYIMSYGHRYGVNRNRFSKGACGWFDRHSSFNRGTHKDWPLQIHVERYEGGNPGDKFFEFLFEAWNREPKGDIDIKNYDYAVLYQDDKNDPNLWTQTSFANVTFDGKTGKMIFDSQLKIDIQKFLIIRMTGKNMPDCSLLIDFLHFK